MPTKLISETGLRDLLIGIRMDFDRAGNAETMTQNAVIRRNKEQLEIRPAIRIHQHVDFNHSQCQITCGLIPDHPALLMLNEIIKRVINEQPAGGFEWEFYNK